MTESNPGPRLPFNEELQQRIAEFVRDTLQAIPELEGLAVVPTWTVPQERLPHGFLRGQRGPLTHPGEIMHMATQLHAVLYDVLGMSMETIRVIDARMQQLAQQLKEQANASAIDGESQSPVRTT